MAKCAICDKTQSNGNKLSITRSHISKRSPRTWKPNLRTVKAEIDGQVKRIHVCAKCLKNGKVKRASELFCCFYINLIFNSKNEFYKSS